MWRFRTFLSSFSSLLAVVVVVLNVCFFVSLFLSFFVCVFMRRVKFRLRIANCVEEDSYCRGGIVHIRGGCSRALFERRRRPKALWRFRVSTSNSPSGLLWLHTHTHLRYIYHTYAQKDIQVCGDDHLKPPNWQSNDPKALSLLRVSI